MNFDKRLKEYYEAIPSAADELKEAMLYSLFTGGKRVRPTLFYTVLKDLNYEGDAAFYFAAAMESIHTYSLIHDDLPAMDDDDFRRGKPSCHKAFGARTFAEGGPPPATRPTAKPWPFSPATGSFPKRQSLPPKGRLWIPRAESRP